MELVPDAGPRLHISDTRQEQRGDDVAVGQALLDSCGHFLEQRVARRLFEQADEGFDLRLEANDLGVKERLGGGNRAEPGEETHVAQADQRAASDRGT